MWKTFIKYLSQDDLYTQALHSCHTMLDLDLEMFKDSIEALRRSDGCETSIDYVATDKRINEFEREVRLKVLSHIAVSGNMGLTSGLALVSVVIDIERIGDYSKNIYFMAKSHPKRLLGGSVEAEITEIENAVDRLFTHTVAAFKTSDADAAREVMNEYKGDLACRCDTLVNNIISGKAADFESQGDAAAIALYVRYLKRVAAHSRNIMTSLVNPFHRIGYKEKKEEVE